MDAFAQGQVSIPAQGALPPGIRVRGARRSFGGQLAVDHIDLDAPPATVTALVGPAGSGKTTLLMMLATLVRPDGGEIRVAGHDPLRAPGRVRARMGWMPDSFGAYETLTAREVLEFVAAAYRFSRTDRTARAAELLEWARLAEYADRPVRVLSRVQKQRLGLARAVVHRPTVLLLDEPAAGLDGPGRAELVRLVRELAVGGAAILATAGTSAEIVGLADRVVGVEAGRSVAVGTPEPIDAEPVPTPTAPWQIRAVESDRLLAAVRGYGLPHRASGGSGVQVMLRGDAEAADLIAALVHDGVRVIAVQPVSSDLLPEPARSGTADCAVADPYRVV